ncbi:hypothetical protein ACOSQ3_006390 [Xanthoceras sorbifolium]
MLANFGPIQSNFQGNFAQQQLDYSYPRQNLNALMAAPSTVADPSWYVDSGATNHITPDFSNLSINNEYKGADRLAVGNGQKLPISHIGSSLVYSDTTPRCFINPYTCTSANLASKIRPSLT